MAFWNRNKHRSQECVAWRYPGGSFDAISDKALRSEHTLIAGFTGCGKSTFLRSIIRAALVQHSPAAAKFIIIDPKDTELERLTTIPHTVRRAVTLDECASALEYACAVMQARQAERRKQRSEVYQGAALYIIVDELNPILTDKYDPKRRTKAMWCLEQIVSLGRSANVHLIACTQNPNKKTIPANISDNCTCRFGLHCMTQEQSRQIVMHKGCENLPKHGETIAIIDGTIGRYKLPYVKQEELDELIDYWTSPACRVA